MIAPIPRPMTWLSMSFSMAQEIAMSQVTPIGTGGLAYQDKNLGAKNEAMAPTMKLADKT